MRYACKNCEVVFPASALQGHHPASTGITCVLIGCLALASIAAGSALWFFIFIALIGVRVWLHKRSWRPMCPVCESHDCVPTDTPIGRRIAEAHDASEAAPMAKATKPAAASRIDFEPASPEEQAILDQERQARASFNRR